MFWDLLREFWENNYRYRKIEKWWLRSWNFVLDYKFQDKLGYKFQDKLVKSWNGYW